MDVNKWEQPLRAGKEGRGDVTARSPAGERRGRRFAVNAAWMIAVSLFMRTAGVSFNVYLSRQAGGEVMGLHALLGGVYGLFLTLGCGGIHLGTTRLTAETAAVSHGRRESVEDKKEKLRRCLELCLGCAAVCGCGAGLLLFTLSPWIGRVWLGDGRTVSSLRVMALSLPPIALVNALSGYFTAVRRVGRNALCSVAAQVARLILCTYLLSLWLPRGTEAACLSLVLGGALSELLNLCLSLAAFLRDRKKHPEGPAEEEDGDPSARKADEETSYRKQPSERRRVSPALPGSGGMTRRLLRITVPVTLAACLRSGLVTLEHSLIPRGLKAGGASWAAALSSYGMIHSLVLPVVLFPSAFISSFSGLLVPEVAEAHARGDDERVRRFAGRVILPVLVFSFGAAGLLSCFAGEIGRVVCRSDQAVGYIRVLAPLVPVMYVDSSVDGILKGMGEQVYSMAVNVIDALTSVILVSVLIPRLGLQGYIITVYVTETLNTSLSLVRMLKITGLRLPLWRGVIAPLLCICGASGASRLLFAALPETVGGIPGLVLKLTMTAGLYLLLLRLTCGFGRRKNAPEETHAAGTSGAEKPPAESKRRVRAAE